MTMGKRMIKAGCLAPAAAAMLLAGCATSDIASDGEWQELVQAGVTHLTNKLSRIAADNHGATSISDGGGGAMVAEVEDAFPVVVASGSGCDPAAAGSSPNAVDFPALRWDYGGFNGAKAVPVTGCEIAGLKVSASGMSYHWEAGGCELLGAEDKGDYNHTVAALFVRDAGGAWRGGKFDWISTSRTSRDFKNIREGYHGWPADAIEAATAYAFVIVSRDGKRRSNVIVRGK